MICLMETLMICPEKKVSDKVLSDKAYNIAKNPIYDGYQRGRALMVYIFFLIKFMLRVQINLLEMY